MESQLRLVGFEYVGCKIGELKFTKWFRLALPDLVLIPIDH